MAECVDDDPPNRAKNTHLSRQGAKRNWNSAFSSRPIRTPRPSPIRTATCTRGSPSRSCAADELGFDYAWVAEHHFSNEYGIMPDVFVYAGYLAALTKRIKIGTAVVTLPLANPLRVAENAAFVDVLSGGRFVLGLGSGYRKYEFDGFGVDFEDRRDIQEEALPLLLELFHNKRIEHTGKHFNVKIDGAYELFPHVGAAAAPADLPRRRDRALDRRRRPHGLRPMLSSWTPFAGLARQTKVYRARARGDAARSWRSNGARGHVDVARWVYVAETDAQAKRESEAGIMKHLAHFSSGHTSGYLGTVSKDVGAARATTTR